MNDKLQNIVKTVKLVPDADIENGCAVAVGSFDGVHLGHRAMISALVSEADRLGLPSAVFTFDSDDNPKSESKLLAMQKDKIKFLAELGVDAVFSSAFSEIRSMSANDFTNGLLYDYIGAKSVVCGYDFRFGNNRSGDAKLIKQLLSPKGVGVVTPTAVEFGGTPVSSTAIRMAVSNGEVAKANKLLGRPFSFECEVVHGKKLGRTLGFPTINQNYPDMLVLPRFGVYAVECVVDNKRYGGVANVGIKPTVGGEALPNCETYLFGYAGDCYGKTVRTEFIDAIREEMRFPSLNELALQVERDKASAQKILAKRSVT